MPNSLTYIKEPTTPTFIPLSMVSKGVSSPNKKWSPFIVAYFLYLKTSPLLPLCSSRSRNYDYNEKVPYIVSSYL